MPRSKLLIPLTCVLGGQVALGAVALAFVGGDDDKPADQAGEVTIDQPGDITTTTSIAGLDGLPPADSTTTTAAVAGADTTAVSLAPIVPGATTTTRPPAATTTTKAPAAKAPGAQGVTKVGSYVYEISSTNDKGEESKTSSTATVSDATTADKVPRRTIKLGDTGQGFSGTATIAYPGNGVINERTVIEAQGSTLDCVWNPAYPRYVAPMKLGTTWAFTTTCTGTFRGGQLDGSQARLDLKADYKVTGTESRSVGAVSYGTWVITGVEDLTVTFTSGAAAGQSLKTHTDQVDRYAPDLAMSTYATATSTFTAFGQTRNGKTTTTLQSAPA